jgi:hypothetical protein
MAKNEAKASGAKKGIGTRDWRGSTVFFCLTPGCVADSEVKANIERHIQRGKHRIAGSPTKSVAPVAEAPVAQDDSDDTDGDD